MACLWWDNAGFVWKWLECRETYYAAFTKRFNHN